MKNFSYTFEKGKTTALVGPSGSGKSTVVQLIERFYDAEEGAVYLDGEDIKSFNLRSWRNTLGYVGQEPVLFNTSIKENLLFGNPDATDGEIVEALKSSNAWSFIEKKMGKDGINTNVGQAGG